MLPRPCQAMLGESQYQVAAEEHFRAARVAVGPYMNCVASYSFQPFSLVSQAFVTILSKLVGACPSLLSTHCRFNTRFHSFSSQH